jgi:hypothetical protein
LDNRNNRSRERFSFYTLTRVDDLKPFAYVKKMQISGFRLTRRVALTHKTTSEKCYSYYFFYTALFSIHSDSRVIMSLTKFVMQPTLHLHLLCGKVYRVITRGIMNLTKFSMQPTLHFRYLLCETFYKNYDLDPRYVSVIIIIVIFLP